MPNMVKKRTNTRSRRLSKRSRMSKCRDALANLQLHIFDCFLSEFSLISSFNMDNLYTKIDFAFRFIENHLIKQVPFSQDYQYNKCPHIIISSSLTYELLAGTLSLKRMHDFYTTWGNRQVGRVAEDFVIASFDLVKPKITARDNNLPFIVSSCDGFACYLIRY